MDMLLSGPGNFRSLQGLRTRDGRRVAGHTLLRSDHLAGLTDDDWLTLQRLGLKTVCDLRSAGERERHPNRLPGPHIRTLHFSLHSDLRGDRRFAAMLQAEADGGQGGEAAVAMMLAIYRSLPHALAPNLRALFDVLEADEVPLLVHCTAGKDRTGFAVAVLLHALGAAPETIVDDYLRTRQSPLLTHPMRLAALQSAVRALMGDCTDPMLDAVLDVREAYLQAAFDEVTRHWGSLDTYLAREAGVDDARLARLRDRYLG